MIWSHLSMPPPSLTSLRPGLPAGADPVLARAMAKAPADRYPRCADFAESLRAALGLAPYAYRAIPAAQPPAGAVPVPPQLPAADHPQARIAWPAEAVATQNSAAGGGPPGRLEAGSPSGGAAAPAGGASAPPAPPATPEPPVAIPAEQTQTAAAWSAQAAQTMPTQARADPGPVTATTGPTWPDGATTTGQPGRPGVPGDPGPAGSGAGPAATRRWLAAGAAIAAVVVVYLVIAAVAHAFPFAKPAHPIVQPTPPVTPIHQSTPVTSPASRIAPLAQLLPADIPVSSCSQASAPDFNFTIVGAVQAYDCQSGNWQVVAFQMDSSADYATTWQNFNKWIGHQPSSAGSNCPPQGSSGQGTVPWSNKYFPQRNGQSLECGTYYSGGSPFPAYAWSFPTENAFLWALGNAGTSWSELDAWWKANETQPAAPSPPAS